MPAQHGFFGPRSARGSAALLPEPPWYYSGDLLTIEYRVNPDRVRELLPDPLGRVWVNCFKNTVFAPGGWTAPGEGISHG